MTVQSAARERDSALGPAVSEHAARQLAERFLGRQRQLTWVPILVGVVLFVGSLAGFGMVGNQQTQLLRTGARATATVVDVAPYSGGGLVGPNSLGRAHVDVAFTTPSGRSVKATLGIGDYTNYQPGQQVAIAYDRVHPNVAVFAHGYTDMGPIGFAFFAGLAIGLCMIIFAIRRWRLWRRVATALQTPSQPMTATSRALHRSRFQNWAIALTDSRGNTTHFWSATTRGCSEIQQQTEVSVFGECTPGSAVLAVAPDRGIAIGGSIPRRWREPSRRRSLRA